MKGEKMGSTIYNALSVLFDTSLIENVKDFIASVMNGLINVFTNANATQYFTMFTAIAGSLMIIFFFIDITDSAAKDMITMERLILSFIKLLIGFSIMIFLPDLLNGLFTIVNEIYNMLCDLNNSQIDFGITFFGKNSLPDATWVEENVKFRGMNGNLGKILKANFYALIISLVISIVGFAARCACYFIAVSNAITLITRAIFSPIAVAQCFEDGQKSNAIRYIKKFAADGLTFAIIVGILYAGSLLQGNIASSILSQAGITEITGTTAMDLLSNFSVLGAVLVTNIAVIGAALKANSIAQDIIGAH